MLYTWVAEGPFEGYFYRLWCRLCPTSVRMDFYSCLFPPRCISWASPRPRRHSANLLTPTPPPFPLWRGNAPFLLAVSITLLPRLHSFRSPLAVARSVSASFLSLSLCSFCLLCLSQRTHAWVNGVQQDASCWEGGGGSQWEREVSSSIAACVTCFWCH